MFLTHADTLSFEAETSDDEVTERLLFFQQNESVCPKRFTEGGTRRVKVVLIPEDFLKAHSCCLMNLACQWFQDSSLQALSHTGHSRVWRDEVA